MYNQDIPFRKRLALELIVQGEHRSDVGSLLGVSQATLSHWATEHEIRTRSPTRKSPRRRRPEELIFEGWANAEVGASKDTVRRWCANAGVPAAPSKGPRRLRAEELLLLGWRDCEVADELGVSNEAVRQWRGAAGIPPLPDYRHHPRRDEIDALLRLGLPHDEIARRLQATLATIGQRRKVLGLPASGQIKDDLGGRHFGRLTAIEIDRERTTRRIKWRCQCSCGRTVSILRTSLILGMTRSCGCLKAEVCRQMKGRRTPQLAGLATPEALPAL